MKRTIHGLDLVFLVFHLHLIKHAVLVEIVVTRSLPKVYVGDVGSVNDFVATVNVSLLPEVLNAATNNRPLWMPENKSTTCILLWELIP